MSPLAVDLKTAAAALGVSVWVLRKYIGDGLIPVVRFPSTERPGEDFRRVLVEVSDLEAFVAKHREVATP